MKSPLKRRAASAQACIDRFYGKPLKLGTRDCVKLVQHDLHKLGLKVPFLKGARWASERSALRLLKAKGFSSLIEALDAMGFARIGHASALPGDIIALPTESPLGALGVYLGHGVVLGFHEDSPNCEQIVLEKSVCAWRVE